MFQDTLIIYSVVLIIAGLVIVIIGMYRQLAEAWTRVNVAEDNFESSQNHVVMIMEDNTRLDEYLNATCRDKAMLEDEILELKTSIQDLERSIEEHPPWWYHQDQASIGK